MLSKRLQDIVEALPLKPGMRILEIGCGPGALAREISKRIPGGQMLAIDRSDKAIRLARAGAVREIRSGRLKFQKVSIEDFEADLSEKPFDFAVAIRVGAFDGRYPEVGAAAYQKLRKALKGPGIIYIDGGNPLRIFKPEKNN